VNVPVRQVRQVDAERFEVVEGDGRLVEVHLRRETRAGLGLQQVAPSAVVAEAVAMLAEDGRWSPTADAADGPAAPVVVDAIALIAAVPGALDDLRARLTA
jgi:hypothetical protein